MIADLHRAAGVHLPSVFERERPRACFSHEQPSDRVRLVQRSAANRPVARRPGKSADGDELGSVEAAAGLVDGARATPTHEDVGVGGDRSAAEIVDSRGIGRVATADDERPVRGTIHRQRSAALIHRSFRPAVRVEARADIQSTPRADDDAGLIAEIERAGRRRRVVSRIADVQIAIGREVARTLHGERCRFADDLSDAAERIRP